MWCAVVKWPIDILLGSLDNRARLDEWWFPSRLGQEKVSSSKLQEWLWNPPSLLFLACRCYSRRVKVAGAWSCLSLPSYADEETAWIYTSILPSSFVVLCLQLPQIANGLAWDRIRTYEMRARWLLRWTTCRMSDLNVKCRRQLSDIFRFRQNNCKKFFIVIFLIADISGLLFYTCQVLEVACLGYAQALWQE